MSLQVGDHIGAYEIVSVIGAGGMGEVYRARDTKLQRDVAVKILPPAFAADPDRVTRFTREAQTLASLNHPHIAQIYGLVDLPRPGRVGHALVMECVDGDDLAQRLSRGALPSTRRYRLRASSPKRSKPRTNAESCIATSSPPT